MRLNIQQLKLMLLSTMHCFVGVAQTTVNGPICVIPEFNYQYKFDGNVTSATVCIEGGIIMDEILNCGSLNPSGIFYVNWHPSTSRGRVTIKANNGSYSLDVIITKPLLGGQISSLQQMIDFNSTLPTLYCSPASGGGCVESFSYSWQYSTDHVNWITMNDQNESDLKFMDRLKETTFFRRLTLHTISKSIAYSNVAVVFVNPPAANSNN